MGAQSQDRLKQFQKKYREWEDPTGIHSIITTTDKILGRWWTAMKFCEISEARIDEAL